ncbi:hypothetical protein HYT92_01455 [Candidatus Pacearchaeota archaeon]|nr:hypothetical protein [Candidatus Pacearchaeota archaeon]
MVSVGVVGCTGNAGNSLIEILGRHPRVDRIYKVSRKERKSERAGYERLVKKSEFVFLALPPGASKDYLPDFGGKRLIDLSIDHRLDSGWVYGLPEINKEEIKNAERVANPGCYATSVILGLVPLKGKISDICIASTSGISGAGLQAQKADNFSTYKEGRAHPQIAEIEKILGVENALFVPQRIDTAHKGIISTIFCRYNGSDKLKELYKKFYDSVPFIEIREDIETKNVIGTNYCSIKVSAYGSRTIIISSLDNLIKGAAGQAVQNFNVMHGFDETTNLFCW